MLLTYCADHSERWPSQDTRVCLEPSRRQCYAQQSVRALVSSQRPLFSMLHESSEKCGRPAWLVAQPERILSGLQRGLPSLKQRHIGRCALAPGHWIFSVHAGGGGIMRSVEMEQYAGIMCKNAEKCVKMRGSEIMRKMHENAEQIIPPRLAYRFVLSSPKIHIFWLLSAPMILLGKHRLAPGADGCYLLSPPQEYRPVMSSVQKLGTLNYKNFHQPSA